MAKLKLKLALDRYDRHVPFFDGTVTVPDGIELEMYKVGQSSPTEHGADRHNRMYYRNEFDTRAVCIQPTPPGPAKDSPRER